MPGENHHLTHVIISKFLTVPISVFPLIYLYRIRLTSNLILFINLPMAILISKLFYTNDNFAGNSLCVSLNKSFDSYT